MRYPDLPLRISKLKSDAIELLRAFKSETDLDVKLTVESCEDLTNHTRFFRCDSEISIKSTPKIER